MPTSRFFDAPNQQNRIKTQIVTKYFRAWADVMLPRLRWPHDRLAYIDLYAGPGKFSDGTVSTPILILKEAIKDTRLREKLVTVFNDTNAQYITSLQQDISLLPEIDGLTYPPQVTNVTVTRELGKSFTGLRMVPTLFFVDPWGYKGLSLDLIGTLIKDWGCDCIFFFNYNRINSAISNNSVDDLMRDLFGNNRLDQLRQSLISKSSSERQAIILDLLTDSLAEVGGKFVLPFEFESSQGERTSHYIIFVSKSFRGYHIMKEVMLGASSDESTVKHFRYVPVRNDQLSFLGQLGLTYTIDSLKLLLLRSCAGQTATVLQIYEENTVATPYTLSNVKDALRELEAEYRIAIDIPADKRPRRNGRVTLADHRKVTFPPR